jgi:signal transduction histidine kinase
VLRQTESDVLLEIEDNGIGFDSNRMKRGLGITNIHNRAELFGGKVVFSSSPGEGCAVNIRLPHAAGLITFE